MAIETINRVPSGQDQRVVFTRPLSESVLLHEAKPLVDVAQDHYALVMARAAIAGHEMVNIVYGDRSDISPEEVRALKKLIDNTAARVATEDFEMLGFGEREANIETDLEASEGKKEGRKNPDDEVWTGEGIYRPRIYFKKVPTIHVSGAGDFAEGTDALARRQRRSISMFAGIIDGKVKPVRSEEEAQYREMLVASPRMEGKLDIEDPIEKTIDILLNTYGLADPKDLRMRVLGGEKRPRNHEVIERARIKGITVEELSHGDAAPMVEAILSDEPIFSAGSGGKEESTITAVIAYARGALWQGRDINVDPKTNMVTYKHPEIWVPSDIVEGDPNDAFFVAVGITGEQYLNLSPIQTNYSPDGKTALWKVEALKASSLGKETEIFTYSST